MQLISSLIAVSGFLVSLTLLSGCSKKESHFGATTTSSQIEAGLGNLDDVKAGRYGIEDPRTRPIELVLARADFIVHLSGRERVTLFRKENSDLLHDLTIEQLRVHAKATGARQLATVLQGKDYFASGPDAPDVQVVRLLKELGFKVIVVQTAHSSDLVIDEVIRLP